MCDFVSIKLNGAGTENYTIGVGDAAELKQCQTLKNMRQNCEYSMELIIHTKLNTALVPGEKSGVFFFS